MAKRIEAWEIADAVDGVGAFPQIQTHRGGNWNIADPRSAYGLIRWDGLPAKPPPFGKLMLALGARLTDVLSAASISGPGFLVSKRVLQLFAELDLGEHGVYPARVGAGARKSYGYFWVHIANDVAARVDVRSSEYRTMKRPFIRGGKPVRFASATALNKHIVTAERGVRNFVRPTHITLRGAPSTYPDLFRYLDTRLYASERLKAAFDREHVSGVQFRPARISFSAR